MRQSQVSGHGSTNVQVGHISAPTFNHLTIFVSHAQRGSSDTSSKTPSGTHQIANEQSHENIRFVTGDYYAFFFCITAKVIHIGQSYPKMNDKNEIDGFLSNALFDDGTGERFSLTIPTHLIFLAPDTDIIIVFASNASKNLIYCGIYDDASGNHTYLELTSNWVLYLNHKESVVLFLSMVCLPALIIICVYLRLWYIKVILDIPTIQSLFVFASAFGLFMHSIFDARKSRILRFIAEKHDSFLAQLVRTTNPS